MKKKNLFLAIIPFFMVFLSEPASTRAQESLKEKYDPLIKNISRRHGIPPDLVHSIILAESNYNSLAVSPKGAMGLMQLMPATAQEYGVRNVFDPEENIEGGVKYLKDIIKLFSGETKIVLAAYNAGQEAVKRFGGIPPYPETKTYISRVMTSYNKPVIRTGTQIFKFYDSSGRLVLTNDPYFHMNAREK